MVLLMTELNSKNKSLLNMLKNSNKNYLRNRGLSSSNRPLANILIRSWFKLREMSVSGNLNTPYNQKSTNEKKN